MVSGCHMVWGEESKRVVPGTFNTPGQGSEVLSGLMIRTLTLAFSCKLRCICLSCHTI